jgi:hypothetical protein
MAERVRRRQDDRSLTRSFHSLRRHGQNVGDWGSGAVRGGVFRAEDVGAPDGPLAGALSVGPLARQLILAKTLQRQLCILVSLI